MKRCFSLILFFVTAQLLIFTATFAEEVSKHLAEGWNNYKSGKYRKALPDLRIAADEGYSSAMHILGDMYAKGHGVNKDLTESEKWYVKAVENTKKDIDEEILNLGIQFYFGDGVIQDYEKAVIWFRKAYKLGNAFAAHSIGIYHLEVSKDYQKAVDWFEIAAKRNIVDSQLMAGGLYGLSKNELIPKNFKKGRYWCQRALENKVATADERQQALDCLKTISKLEAIW